MHFGFVWDATSGLPSTSLLCTLLYHHAFVGILLSIGRTALGELTHCQTSSFGGRGLCVGQMLYLRAKYCQNCDFVANARAQAGQVWCDAAG